MFYKIINLIKLNVQFKNKTIITKLYKKDFIILNIFIKLNIIKCVKKFDKNRFLILLNVKRNFNDITNLYKPSKPININLKTLKKQNKKRTSIFYISTNKGLINNFLAEKNKTGGFLVMSIWM